MFRIPVVTLVSVQNLTVDTLRQKVLELGELRGRKALNPRAWSMASQNLSLEINELIVSIYASFLADDYVIYLYTWSSLLWRLHHLERPLWCKNRSLPGKRGSAIEKEYQLRQKMIYQGYTGLISGDWPEEICVPLKSTDEIASQRSCFGCFVWVNATTVLVLNLDIPGLRPTQSLGWWRRCEVIAAATKAGWRFSDLCNEVTPATSTFSSAYIYMYIDQWTVCSHRFRSFFVLRLSQ